MGLYAGLRFDLEGTPISEAEWNARKDAWLPTEADHAYVRSLMTKPVYEPGKMAQWISAPKQGIKGRPVDFEYVRREV